MAVEIRRRNSKNGTPEEREAARAQRVPGKRGRKAVVYCATVGKSTYENVRPARLADFGEELVLPGNIPAALKETARVVFTDGDGKEWIAAGVILAPADAALAATEGYKRVPVTITSR
jgi:hypothetical protein